jgi:tRNA U34 5-methylaminomethyl-2-thiouridine-forming methyltransferase MnmC
MSSAQSIIDYPHFAEVYFKDGFPHSTTYDDRYFLNQYGLAETEYVYLFNKEIAERFNQQQHFVIAEIGFGIGLNFLATLDLWMRTAQMDRTLIYISCEINPLTPKDLAQALSYWSSQLDCASLLLDAYQAIVPGLNTFVFLEAKVILILLIGEAKEQLSLTNFTADHWMLDGFSPLKNSSAWSDELISQISRLSYQKTTLATFSAAGFVKRSLEAHGWIVSKVKGFGTKRHRLIGHFSHKAPFFENKPCLVSGSGIAGISFQFFRSFLGYDVLAVDGPWQRASTIPYAYAHPALQARLTPFSLFGLRTHLMSGHFYRQFCPQQGIPLGVAPTMQKSEHRRAEIFSSLAHQAFYKNIIHLEGTILSFPQGYSLCGAVVLKALSDQSQQGVIKVHDVSGFIKQWKAQQGDNHLFMAANSFAFQHKLAPPCHLLRGQLRAYTDRGAVHWLKGTHERYAFKAHPQPYTDNTHLDMTDYRSDFVGFRSIQRSYLPYFGLLESNTMVSLYHGSRGFSSGLWCGLILALKSLNIFSYKYDGSF